MTTYDDAPTNVQGPPPPPGRPLNKDQKSAIAAALVGVAALGGAAYGMAQYLDDDGKVAQNTTPPPHEEPPHADPPPADKHETPVVDQVPVPDPPVEPVPSIEEPRVSEQNHDPLTFEDAFREARTEMGPGHYFEWHGQLYNTYHQAEWEGMSHQQHQDFLASVYGDDAPGMSDDGSGGVLADSGEIPPVVDVADDVPADDAVVAIDDSAPQPVNDQATVTVDEPAPVTAADDDGTVTVDPAVEAATGDGQASGDDPDVAVIDVDGHEITVFDMDHDGRPDAVMGNEDHVVLMDTNHDHILDTQATYDTTTHHFTDVHEMENHLAIDGNMDILHQSDTAFAGDFDMGPDFDNDADVSDLI